ncbi:Cell surface glycoprotein MUC18, partial [Chaetura pelagica]
DAKTFICQVVTDSHGTAENHTELYVYKVPEVPEILAYPGGISVQSSSLSEIAQCVSRNSFPPPNITWHKNGEQLQPEDNRPYLENKSYEGRLRELGLFSCPGSWWSHHPWKTLESRRVNITVFYPAEHVNLQVKPSPALVKEGDDVQLVCEADGNPAPVFSFYKRELEDNWQDLSSLSDANTGVLDLHHVTKNSSGLYKCQTLDLDDMRQMERDVELVVNWKPRIVAISSPVYVRQDEVVNLTCKAIGVPSPSFRWSVSGMAHEYVENQHITSNLTVRVNPELLRKGAKCTVFNTLGSMEESIQLLNQKTPESKGVIIVAIIICILVVAVLGSVIYFLHKKGKIPCGRSGKQDM